MCNLYPHTTNRQAVLRLFRVGDNRAAARAARRDISGVLGTPLFGWLLTVTESWLRCPGASFALSPARPYARSPTRAFKARRCLVPASAFCEPKGDVKPATWHWFAVLKLHDHDAELASVHDQSRAQSSPADHRKPMDARQPGGSGWADP
jgi:hypothetical protein